MSLEPDYKKIPVSLIATVLNEMNTIEQFLQSYRLQSTHASEFIIVDAGSNDGTFAFLQNFSRKHSGLHIKLLQKPGIRRGAARNLAIQSSTYQTIAMTDAGCRLDRQWLEQLWLIKNEQKAAVVGGFFAGDASNRLQQAMVPYFLQLGVQVTAANFVPTSRSLLLDKQVFLDVGGFREDLVLSEDYELMLRLKKLSIRFAFAKQALVYWQPPTTLLAFAQKIMAFAHSDATIGIVRWKVLTLYGRYLFFFLVWSWQIWIFILFFGAYLWWSIWKNYAVARKGWFYLPFLQLISDVAVILGTSLGFGRLLLTQLRRER